MKLTATLILSLFLLKFSVGQKYPQTLVDSFCNETILYYYTDFAKPLDSIEAESYEPRDPYIMQSELTTNLKTQFNGFIVRYVTQQQALEEIAATKDRMGSFEKISVTQLPDTIDVNIGGWAIHVTKVKQKNRRAIPIHSNFYASCGGTLGYIPTCRFIYDKRTRKWIKYTWQESAQIKMKALQLNENK